MGSRCKSCGAEIIWVRSKNGSAMPLDAEPHPEGNVFVEDGIGHVMKHPPGHRCPEGIVRYRSHFSSCSEAASHRKK